jgi:predicted acetyltransferase
MTPTPSLKVVPIVAANAHIFDVFEQDYEAEFSKVTQKEPNVDGRFTIEADWKPPYHGFYLFKGALPTGFAIRGVAHDPSNNPRSDMAEFYILPRYRKKGYGKYLAFALFDTFPGPWQVRQIRRTTEAIEFWRRVIFEYTQDNYTEVQIEDPHWGEVLCQLFESRVTKPLKDSNQEQILSRSMLQLFKRFCLACLSPLSTDCFAFSFV